MSIFLDRSSVKITDELGSDLKILEGQIIPVIQYVLTYGDFYFPNYKVIYKAIVYLYNRRKFFELSLHLNRKAAKLDKSLDDVFNFADSILRSIPFNITEKKSMWILSSIVLKRDLSTNSPRLKSGDSAIINLDLKN